MNLACVTEEEDFPALFEACLTCERVGQYALLHSFSMETAMGMTFYALERDTTLAIRALCYTLSLATRQEHPKTGAFISKAAHALEHRLPSRVKSRIAQALLKFAKDAPTHAAEVYAALTGSPLRTIRKMAYEEMNAMSARQFADTLERELEKPTRWAVRVAIRLLSQERLQAHWKTLWEHGRYADHFALMRRGVAIPLSAIEAKKESDPLGWAVWSLVLERPVSDEEILALFWSVEREASVVFLFYGLAQAGKRDLLLQLSREYGAEDFAVRLELRKLGILCPSDASPFER